MKKNTKIAKTTSASTKTAAQKQLENVKAFASGKQQPHKDAPQFVGQPTGTAKKPAAKKAEPETRDYTVADQSKIKVLKTDNPCRPGSFCYAQVQAVLSSNGKTIAVAQDKLAKDKKNPTPKRALETAWLQKKGFIKIQPIQ